MYNLSDLQAQGLLSNTWFNALTLEKHPEGLPCKEAAIDFEWCVSDVGARALAPLIGTAICTETRQQYIWLSERWHNKNHKPKLCSVGSQVQHLIVHNLKADRPKIAEAYDLWEEIEWSCTLSMNIVLAGCGGQQSWAHRSTAPFKPNFVNHSSPNSLLEVHNYWVPGSTLTQEDKRIRKAFVDLQIPELREMFTELLSYALKDPLYTLEVYEAMAPEWQSKFPSDLRQRAQRIRGRTSLCVAPWFDTWADSCESQYQEKSAELKALCQQLLKAKAQEYKSELMATLQTYDAFPKHMLKKNGTLMKKYESTLAQNLALNPKTQNVIAKWANSHKSKKQEGWLPSAEGVALCLQDSTLGYGSQLVQDLCGLEYYGKPIVFDPELKFCYREPDGGIHKIFSPKKGPMTKDNCGSIFAKDFVPLFENGAITSESPIANKIVRVAAELSYWVSVRSRIFTLQLQGELAPIGKTY